MDDDTADIHYLDKRLALAFVRKQAWRMLDGGELNMSQWVDSGATSMPQWLDELSAAIAGEFPIAARFSPASPGRAAFLGWSLE